MLLLWCIRSLVNCLTSNSSSQVALNSCRNAFTMVSNFICLALLVDLKRCRSFMTIFAYKFLHKKWGVGIWSDYEYWFVLFDLITLGCEPRLVCDCIRDFPGSACQASLWRWSPGMERHTATRHESFNSICKALDLVFADNDNTSWNCWSSSSSIFGVMYCSSFFQSKINHSTALSSPGRYWMCHTERDNPRVGKWDTPLRGQLLTKFDFSYNLKLLQEQCSKSTRKSKTIYFISPLWGECSQHLLKGRAGENAYYYCRAQDCYLKLK